MYQSVAFFCAILLQCAIRSGRNPSRFEAKCISREPGRAEDGEDEDPDEGGKPLNQRWGTYATDVFHHGCRVNVSRQLN
jgi:hypothetical protein